MRSMRSRRKDAGHDTLGSYVTGFILALFLTAAAFWLVMAKVAPAPILFVAILVLAAVQVGVHLRCFLHIDGSVEGRWNLIALMLAIVILFVVVVGSLWVVYELNAHMMPWMTADG